uniref:Uncharacterized protein n=1 Tax=Chlamydomonas euryale TaxID=1486919 RepID=A0A7R9V6G6_9CHLO
MLGRRAGEEHAVVHAVAGDEVEAPAQHHPFLGWYDDSEQNVSKATALNWYAGQRAAHAGIVNAFTIEYDSSHADGFDASARAGCRGETWCLRAAEAMDIYGLVHVVPPPGDQFAITGSKARWEKLKAAAKRAESRVTQRINDIAGEDVCFQEPSRKDMHELSWQVKDAAMRHYHRLDSTLFIDGVLRELPTSHALFAVADHMLNGTAHVLDVGIVDGLPGSQFQVWHQDYGESILRGARRTSGFPFAINVFMPLVDMDEELGPPEFSIRDHLSWCELPDSALRGAQSLDAKFTVHYAAYSVWDRIYRWWHCLSIRKDKVRGVPPAELQQRLTQRLTLRPDMSPTGSFLAYDYMAWHRATPNFSPHRSRPALYVLLGRDRFVDAKNFRKDWRGGGLMGGEAEEYLRGLWEVDAPRHTHHTR